METLDSLEQNLQTLLQRLTALQQENEALRAKVEDQHQEIVRTHSENLDLRRQCTWLHDALAFTGREKRDEAYKRITQLIRQVDNAIAALKQ